MSNEWLTTGSTPPNERLLIAQREAMLQSELDLLKYLLHAIICGRCIVKGEGIRYITNEQLEKCWPVRVERNPMGGYNVFVHYHSSANLKLPEPPHEP